MLYSDMLSVAVTCSVRVAARTSHHEHDDTMNPIHKFHICILRPCWSDSYRTFHVEQSPRPPKEHCRSLQPWPRSCARQCALCSCLYK